MHSLPRYLLDQLVRLPEYLGYDSSGIWQEMQPPPDKEEDPLITKLREKLKLSLQEVRKNAE